MQREGARASIIARLDGCAPANALPGEMLGYLNESALRFHCTLQWVRECLAESSETDASLLETGSNPYFLTLLLRGEFPRLRHVGINYFGEDSRSGTMQSQAVVDPQHRLTEAVYFYGDIERHSLDPLGTFDLCLLCEVVEHLVYDPAWALFNVLERLRVGGHMILTTPNPARLENISRMILHSGSNADPISGYGIHGRHNREYTMTELHDLLVGAGCRVVQSRTIDVNPRDWSRSAEARGHGEYLMVKARVEREVSLYRPGWLYRSFDPAVLQSRSPLHA